MLGSSWFRRSCVLNNKLHDVSGRALYPGFIDEVSALFVFGGSLFTVMARNSFAEFLSMIGSFPKYIYYSMPNP